MQRKPGRNKGKVTHEFKHEFKWMYEGSEITNRGEGRLLYFYQLETYFTKM